MKNSNKIRESFGSRCFDAAVLLVVTMLPVAAMAEELTPDEPAGEPVVSEAVTTEPAGEETPAGEDETENP